MGAGKLGSVAGRGVAALGVVVLATSCASASSAPAAAWRGAFPATTNGTRALTVCQQWAGLRGQYVNRVLTDTPFQLEQWFSSTAWLPAFNANSPLKTDPRYGNISTAFGLVSTATAASLDSARSLDAACAAAD